METLTTTGVLIHRLRRTPILLVVLSLAATAPGLRAQSSTVRNAVSEGNARYLAGDFAGAQAKYQAAIDEDATYAPAHTDKALACGRLGDLDSALAAALQAVTLAPTDADKLVPLISWETPAPILYGTALGANQLNATANTPGTFSYAPAAGTVLRPGVNQVLRAEFAAADPANWAAAAPVSVTIDVDVLLTLEAGWNLVSLPFTPLDSAVSSVFGDGGRGGGETTGVFVWRSDLTPPTYEPAATVAALRGYWVYASQRGTVTVRGVAPARTDVTLVAGWNLMGPAVDVAMPAALVGFEPVWGWKGASYVAARRLSVGRGYWVYLPERVAVDLGR